MLCNLRKPILKQLHGPFRVRCHGDLEGVAVFPWHFPKTMLDQLVRFAPATLYRELPVDHARSDQELSKAYKRPGQVIQIDLKGSPIQAIGDVEFAMRRHIEQDGALHDIPYWFCSFCSDLDPRLFHEFSGSDACIIIFDPMEFVRRALPHLNRAAPMARKELFPNQYFDPYFRGAHKLSPLVSKEMSFAYQREMRFVLDPEGGAPLADSDLFVEIGPLADIAAVYAPTGERISQVRGPTIFCSKAGSDWSIVGLT